MPRARCLSRVAFRAPVNAFKSEAEVLWGQLAGVGGEGQCGKSVGDGGAWCGWYVRMVAAWVG